MGNGATVNFANLTPVCDAPVVDTDGVTRLAGPTFKAALFYAPDNGSTPSAGSMVPVGSAVPFMTGARAGYVQGGTVALPTTTPPGSTAYFQLRAWDTTVGGAASSTYQNAVNNGEKVGASAILKIPTGNPGAVPPGTPGLLCLNSFALVSPAATPLGTAVQVQAIDPAAQASVTVTFANVTSAGTTTLQAIPSTAAPSLSAFKITVGTTPVFFELKTTAVFTPPVQVCFSYAGLSFVPNAILHYPVGGPSWSAPFGTVSPSGKTICGTVNSLSPFAVAKLDPVDTDHDGVLDDDDACPNSDLRPTVVIDGCNSGVPNRLLAHGCTISDLIAECATGVKNHGQFVSRVADLTNLLKKQGLITAQQKGAIETCAGKARIGK